MIIGPDVPYTQDALRFVIRLGQWFLLMPITLSSDNKYWFKWTSGRSITSLTLVVLSLVATSMFLNYVFAQEKKFPSTSGFTFYLTIFVYETLFINFSQALPSLMLKWEEIDNLMRNYTIVENYVFKMKFVSYSLMALAVAEHVFFIASFGLFGQGLPLQEELKNYFTEIFRFVFNIFPYSIFAGFFVQILNWLWTIIWNYVDAFLIALCICFTFRLKQIEHKVSFLVKLKVQDISHWREVREHFIKLGELCCELESSISPLVLVSFANKFYVVLYQLLGLLDGEKYGIDVVNRLYYSFSFLYILLRLAGVIFFASSIDLKSQDIAMKLFETPSEVYNIEIERFISNLKMSPPIITGAKIFKIQKSLLLKIASSIIIYELVIIKFQKY
ncbi:gustatory receptor for sugar taste 64e-like [Euwallacea similis]|uniref:gustatory receptor for sugar taste 64e-like n=1 Tax=Euwallacea similis TaxID=1736056 RepID=UPI00344E530B